MVNIPEMAAEYVHKLLAGTRVAELPVRFPDKTEFAFNVKTARSHGWAPPAPGSRPASFEAEVDRWIVE